MVSNKNKFFIKKEKEWEKEAYEKANIYSDICKVNEMFIKDLINVNKDFRSSVGQKVCIMFSEAVRFFKKGYMTEDNNEKIIEWTNCLKIIEDISCQLKFMSAIRLSFNYGLYYVDIGNIERQLNFLIKAKQKLMDKEEK